MSDTENIVLAPILVGIGATMALDLWSIARKSLQGISPPDYGLVGRWIGHMLHGRFRHDAIGAAAPVRAERLIGWVAHYLIGIAFACVLLGLWGLDWLGRPTLVPALLVGVGSVVSPFLLMQPSMGAGIAASRTPRPAAARLRSLITHAVFGVGLYAAGWVVNLSML